GDCGREEVYSLKREKLTQVQDAMTRKLVGELTGFDNILFEICNEPYFGGVTLEWQRHIAAVIRSEERRVGKEGRTRVAANQAEDGIRDRTVTGVQTCALPIWRLRARRGLFAEA